MIPGTTPTFIIKIKDDNQYLLNTTSLRIDIRQQDVLLTKNTEDIVIDTESSTLTVTLSQEESLKFLYKKGDIEFQVHGLLSDNQTSWKTHVVTTAVERTLSKEMVR